MSRHTVYLMKKILIVQNKILHYRKALYNELSIYYNITVLHSGYKSLTKEDKYKEVITNKTNFFSFEIQHRLFSEVRKDYDVVIVMFDLHWLKNFLIPYIINKNTDFIWWGQWLNDNSIANYLKVYFSNKNIKSILYTESAKKQLIRKGVKENKLFVANNTFNIDNRYKCFQELEKKTILFVGSLDKRKELVVLLKAFSKIIEVIPKSINLIIIGDGEEKENLIKLIDKLSLKKRILMKGEITSNIDLIEYYKKALVHVSYGQAGLSVLQSFGFGVPFITKINAISGGEKTNIINGYNGYLCEENEESLVHLLQTLSNNQNLARKLGENAYEYYTEKCTIRNMANGFINAIESN